jgi:hypothetical protein
MWDAFVVVVVGGEAVGKGDITLLVNSLATSKDAT